MKDLTGSTRSRWFGVRSGFYPIYTGLLSLLLFSGCSTYEYHETVNTSASRFETEESYSIAEAELLRCRNRTFQHW